MGVPLLAAAAEVGQNLGLFEAWRERDDFWYQTAIFLSLILRGLGLGLLLSLPLGIVLSRFPRWASPVISVFALVQTIPGLALLGFCISMLNIFGATAAVTAAAVYSLFPIVLNTCTGIIQVEARLKDAARGMGMTNLQILRKVELPLALPVILAGIRTGAVYAIGMVTICAIVGANGLGMFITTGMSRGDAGLTLLGAIPILLLTVAFFLGLTGIATLARKNSSAGLLLGGGLIVLMAGYALTDAVVTQLLQGPDTQLIAETLQQRSLAATWQQTTNFAQQSWLFLSLTLRGLGLALLLGLPLGLALTRCPQPIAATVLWLLALVQTVPSLALLGFCVSLFGLFGASAAIFATVVYSLYPVVLNTYTGIMQVDARLKDAARGMGMTGRQVLTGVELPLALPVIIAGVRTAATYAIAMMTIGAMVGARGLGDYILFGMDRKDNGLILLGVLPILLLTLAFFWGLGGIVWLSRKNASLGQYVSAGLIVLMSGFAVVEPLLRPHSAAIRIGSKNFTENLLLGEMLRLMLETHTDLSVEQYPNLGSNYAFQSLLADKLDLYPEYTGTLLTAEDALNLKVPADKSTITDLVRRELRQRFDVVLLEPFGLNNTYVIAVPRRLVRKHNLKTISDLQKVPDFRLVVDQEFLERPDGWKGLVDAYDLHFRQRPQQFGPNFLYEALLKGRADAVIGFATNWQIDAYDLVTLEDNKNYFPSYHAAPIARADTLQRYPQIRPVLERLGGQIDDETMRQLNRQVVVQKKSLPDVAYTFLESRGLLDSGP